MGSGPDSGCGKGTVVTQVSVGPLSLTGLASPGVVSTGISRRGLALSRA
jgi:hypothetical protein